MGKKNDIRSDGPDALTRARGRAIAAIAKAAARGAKDHALRSAPFGAKSGEVKVTRFDCECVAEIWGMEIITDLIRAAMLKDPKRIGRIADRWTPKKAAEPAGGTAAELLARLSAATKD